MSPTFKERKKDKSMEFYSTRLEYLDSKLESDDLFYHLVSSLSYDKPLHERLLDTSAAINMYLNNSVKTEDILGLAIGDAEFISLKAPEYKKNDGIIRMDLCTKVATIFLDIEKIRTGQTIFNYGTPKDITFTLKAKEDISLLSQVSTICGFDMEVMYELQEKIQILMDKKAETFSIYHGKHGKPEIFLHSSVKFTGYLKRDEWPDVENLLRASISGAAFFCTFQRQPHTINAINVCIKKHESNFYCPIHPNLFVKQLVGSDIRYKFPRVPIDWKKNQLCLISILQISHKINNLYCDVYNSDDPEPLRFPDFLLNYYCDKDVDYAFISEIIIILSNGGGEYWRIPNDAELSVIQTSQSMPFLSTTVPIVRLEYGPNPWIAIKSILNVNESQELLYHGTSYFSCQSILEFGVDLALCSRDGHIGSGFYTTTSSKYAVNHARRIMQRFKTSTPLLLMIFKTSSDRVQEPPFTVLNALDCTLDLHEQVHHKNDKGDIYRSYLNADIVHAKLITCRDSKRNPGCCSREDLQRTYRNRSSTQMLLSRLIGIVLI